MIITTDTQSLTVILHGREQVWSLRAKVAVPRNSIKSIRFEPRFNDWRRWEVRMPGASIPGHLVAGSYWTEEGWDFLYIKNPGGIRKPVANDVLVIETDQSRYCRIIVTCDKAEADTILKWWSTKAKASAKKAKK